MSDRLRIDRDVSIALDEVELRTSRSSGPGGQHANVTASRVEAVFEVEASRSLTETQKRRVAARHGARVVAVAQDARGQARNRALALERLAARIASALVVPRARRPTRPSRAAKVKRLDSKRRQGERKQARRRPGDDGG